MSDANIDLARVVYLLMALVLVGSGVFWASRRARVTGAEGPGPFVSLLIWAVLMALALLLYRGAAIWTAVVSLFR